MQPQQQQQQHLQSCTRVSCRELLDESNTVMLGDKAWAISVGGGNNQNQQQQLRSTFLLMGDIVKISRSSVPPWFVVDDGTGTIRCAAFSDDFPLFFDRLDVGAVVDMIGRLNLKLGYREFVISNIEVIDDPNFESLRWLDIVYNRAVSGPMLRNLK